MIHTCVNGDNSTIKSAKMNTVGLENKKYTKRNIENKRLNQEIRIKYTAATANNKRKINKSRLRLRYVPWLHDFQNTYRR